MARRPEVPRAGSTAANIAAAAVLVAVVGATPFVVSSWDEITHGLQDRVAAIPQLEAERERERSTGSESLLLLAIDEAGSIGSIALAGAVDGESSTMTIVPTTLFELLPGYGDFALADAVRFEGPELARVAVSNALGVRVDRVSVLAAGAIAGLSDVEFVIELSEPVVALADSGATQIGQQGIARYAPETVEALLTFKFDSSPVGWLDRQAAVWSAVLEELEASPTLAAELLGEGESAVILSRVAANEPEVSLIPVTPVAVAGADDGFQLIQAEVVEFVVDRLTHLALASRERPRVEVLNGNGEILATRSVVDALVAAGFHIVRTDNAENFDFEETVIISQGRPNRDAAARAAAELGVRTVQLEVVAASGIVDVSIIVGHDIATLRS